jgi:chromate transporter
LADGEGRAYVSGAVLAETVAAPRPTLAEATRVWLKIGFLGFGGPAGQIALMHRFLVEERKWVSEERFLHALNFCMLLPGPEAQQLATYVGWLLHGTRGGIVAGTLFVLPGLAVILALSTVYALFQRTAWLESLFFGLKAAVLAIVIEALIRIGRRALKTRASLIIAVSAFLAIFVLGIPFPLIILAAGLLGYVGARFQGDDRAAGTTASSINVVGPVPRGSLHVFRTVAIWGGLWAAPVVLAGIIQGWEGIYAQLGGFFSLMAVVTFGGAYAVLAYVADAAVNAYGWLTAGEMLDGLALAETTPGPLILVLSFVGYLAAFRLPGALDPVIAGILGGLLTAWVTFIPSFLWIFLGAPYMERLRGNRNLSAALSAITAAVVGVIANLALFLGLHVLFGEVGTLAFGPVAFAWPVWSTVDPWAVALFVMALVALFVVRIGLIPTLAASAVLGFAVMSMA